MKRKEWSFFKDNTSYKILKEKLNYEDSILLINVINDAFIYAINYVENGRENERLSQDD